MMVVGSGEQDNSVTSSGNSRSFGEHYLAHRIQKPIPKLYFHDFFNPNDGCWIGGTRQFSYFVRETHDPLVNIILLTGSNNHTANVYRGLQGD